MIMVEHATRITFKNIIYLTDFSEPSEVALPFATAIAREYGGKITALHVLAPPPYVFTTPEVTALSIEGLEDAAQVDMERVAAQLIGVPHETMILRGASVWPALQDAIKRCSADLLVLGTHGRTGAQKLLLGSVAEEIFRRATIPVLTIGPHVKKGAHNAGRYHRILCAVDFTPQSLAAAPYAISLAQENQARLILLHAAKEFSGAGHSKAGQLSVAEAMHQLHDVVPEEAALWCRPEAVVEFGDPRERIVQTAIERGVDLIVMGVRNRAGRLGATTHLELSTAHSVVAHAACPVLTVRT
jgi:nucleotide-binding universal stress UspA family protein